MEVRDSSMKVSFFCHAYGCYRPTGKSYPNFEHTKPSCLSQNQGISTIPILLFNLAVQSQQVYTKVGLIISHLLHTFLFLFKAVVFLNVYLIS